MKRVVVLAVLLVVLIAIRFHYIEPFADAGKGINVTICKAEWCGHCKKAAPEFKKLVDASPITLKNGIKATVNMLDADQNKEEIKKYNVRGYPSILIIKDGEQPMEYPGERTHQGVVDFLNSL